MSAALFEPKAAAALASLGLVSTSR
jgi:hypothetical protein